MDPSIASGLFAAVVAIVATVAIEKFGARLGGLLATIPTTIVPASLGFWWTSPNSPEFYDALYAVSGGMLVNAGFLFCWRVLPRVFGGASVHIILLKVTVSALFAWAGLSFLLFSLIHTEVLPLFILSFAFVAIQIGFGVVACWRRPQEKKGTSPVGLITLLARGLLAGTAIAFSVWLAGLGVPVVAGMASVFPAIFLTTMVSVWLSQGAAVPIGAVSPMILGSSSVSIYALIATWSLPAMSPGIGALVAWLASVALISLPSWFFLNWSGQKTTSAG